MAFIKFTTVFVISIIIYGCCASETKEIAGDQSVHGGEFPYHASLRLGGQHFCSGAIISASHILTASHCVVNMRAPFVDVTIVTGSTKRLGGHAHYVKHIIHHPNLIQKVDMSMVNDLAVIMLQQPMVVDNFQRPIPIATTGTLRGSTAVLTGYGKRFTTGRMPDTLIATNVSVLSRDECQMLVKPHIYLTYLCTVSDVDDGPCNEDSGSPVVSGNELIGIVSWTYGNCGDGNPDVSVQVTYYNQFIADAMNYQG